MSGACGERFRAAVAGWPPAAQLLGFTNVPEEHAPDAAQALLRAIGSLLPTASYPLTAPDIIGAESR